MELKNNILRENLITLKKKTLRNENCFFLLQPLKKLTEKVEEMPTALQGVLGSLNCTCTR